jgi:hypothetical protein
MKQEARQKSGKPETFAHITRCGLREILPNLSNYDFKESKLSDASGQYFFREPINKDIPETG